MEKIKLLIGASILLLSGHVHAAIIHQWDFSGYADGTVLSSVEDSINGVYFDSGLDTQSSVQNGLLQINSTNSMAVADILQGQDNYTWTVGFQSLRAYEDAIGDGQRLQMGLYSSDSNIRDNVHPTSSAAQIRFLSTNPPSDQMLVRRFTTQSDSAVLLDSYLTDFEISFAIEANNYEVTLTDNGISNTLFSGSDIEIDDITSIQHFILSGTAFNGGFIEAEINNITIESLSIPGPPAYDGLVTTEQDFFYDILLGETLSFDFLWEMGTEPTGFNIDILGFRGDEWEVFGLDFNVGGSSTDWDSYVMNVPDWAVGEETELMFRVYDFGQETDPTVYLRNIESTSVPEPSVIALMLTGLIGLGLARRKIRI